MTHDHDLAEAEYGQLAESGVHLLLEKKIMGINLRLDDEFVAYPAARRTGRCTASRYCCCKQW